MAVKNRAVFLDKDGTLVEDLPYNVDPARIRFATNALRGVRAMHCAGYQLYVVSNQSGVARGLFEEEALDAVERKLRQSFERAGACLAGFYYCPHHPEGTRPDFATACDCRKPAPGMLRRAAADHGIALQASWLVGDILDDVEAGNAAGCRTILVDNGGETEWRDARARRPTAIARDLAEAARIIVSRECA